MTSLKAPCNGAMSRIVSQAVAHVYFILCMCSQPSASLLDPLDNNISDCSEFQIQKISVSNMRSGFYTINKLIVSFIILNMSTSLFREVYNIITREDLMVDIWSFTNKLNHESYDSSSRAITCSNQSHG